MRCVCVVRCPCVWAVGERQVAEAAVSAPRRGQPARSWAEEEAADAMYYEHLHGDGMTQLGLLKPGGRAAHRFYLLAMARRRGGGEGGEGGEGDGGGDAGGGTRHTSMVPGDRGTRTNAKKSRERKKAARVARKASASGDGGE